jgi:hypothetical protein
MLVEFRVGNFLSFKQEQVLSLVASSDTALPYNLTEVGGLRLLRVAAIYGPNASGKSNLIKAIEWSSDFILNSTSTKPDSDISIMPFLLDENSRNKPSFFEFTMMIDKVRYQYGFEVDGKKVCKEWLLAYSSKKAQLWFERKYDNSKNDYDWKFSSFLKGEKEKVKTTTRKNVLFLSAAAQWNNEQLTKVYLWFKDKLRTLMTTDAIKPITAELLKEATQNKYEIIKDYILNSLRSADIGIDDVEVEDVNKETFKFPEGMSAEAKEKVLKRIHKSFPFDVRILHRAGKSEEKAVFPLAIESDGTQRLFSLLGPWIQLVVTGMTAVLDEIDRSLHPLLTRKLVEIVQKPDIKDCHNERQLIFSSHDTTLFDPTLLRRDQIWLTQKDETGATELYSLVEYDEHKVRKGEAMQKGYLSGRYGAIPFLDKFGFANGQK